MDNRFVSVITSPPDREKLVVELWFQDELIAEVNQEKEMLEVEIYPNSVNVYVLDDLLTALNEAKKKLLNS